VLTSLVVVLVSLVVVLASLVDIVLAVLPVSVVDVTTPVEAVVASAVGSLVPVGAVPVGIDVVGESPAVEVEVAVSPVSLENTGVQPPRPSTDAINDTAAK
jgi:hypothetical protein